MKKLVIAMMAAVGILISGCEWNETTITSAANTAGSIAVLTWFSIDNPDQAVKTVLKDVVNHITKATVAVGEGKTYLESLPPEIQAIALKQEKLNDYQKTLINAGAVVILNGIDTYIATNEKIKKDAVLVNKVVSAFGNGCLSVLNLPADCPECQVSRQVYAKRSLKCRSGKFVEVK